MGKRGPLAAPCRAVPLTAEQAQLVADHIALGRDIARPYLKGHPGLADDIVSATHWGLVQAAQSYEPARGAFTTIASWRVRGEIRDTLTRCWEDHTEGLANRVVPDRPAEPGLESEEAFVALLRRVSLSHRAILRLRYWDGMAFAQIGARLGIATSTAQLWHNQALDVLRRRLGRPPA